MRFVSLALIVFVFLALPFYLLNALVMPELAALQQTYLHADEIAAHAAGVQQ